MVVLYILCIMFICIYPWPVADAERYGDHLEVITVCRHVRRGNKGHKSGV